jgi:hypothetical protein
MAGMTVYDFDHTELAEKIINARRRERRARSSSAGILFFLPALVKVMGYP